MSKAPEASLGVGPDTCGRDFVALDGKGEPAGVNLISRVSSQFLIFVVSYRHSPVIRMQNPSKENVKDMNARSHIDPYAIVIIGVDPKVRHI